MYVLDTVIRFPGRTHDRFIWANSNISEQFASGEISGGWLLGGSGYPLQPCYALPTELRNTTIQLPRKEDASSKDPLAS
ncbi:putative nuclease HARBI1 [Acipenser oxyrinchus oxyrinchus]|uniref:Nuclease HARBI1 n=1 Tax=Acipenser oxyrinchus oxyrinchus TaxID=40147 RepID=A0AAD8LTJ9_ACIOX|nr:putative nuclease HARBI1 [Acipenser oxyrinchus oxyrinchus]